jgi:hypothetical protein
MPKPINVNRPLNLQYDKGNSNAAAYRASLTLKEAANTIKKSARGEALKRNGWKCTTILKDIITHKKHFRSKFNTNPWVGNIAANAKEYTVESEVWRLISYSPDGKESAWFLAHHIGANNDFEFWHISNTKELLGAAKQTGRPGPIKPLTSFDLADDQWGDTVELVVPVSDAPAPDSWEDSL